MDSLTVISHKRAPRSVQFGVHLMIDGYVADGRAQVSRCLKTSSDVQ